MSERAPKPQLDTAGDQASNNRSVEQIADSEVLATPTPFDIILEQGSESKTNFHIEAYNLLQQDLEAEVSVIDNNFTPDPVRDRLISPAGPAMDALNLMARLVHDKKTPNRPTAKGPSNARAEYQPKNKPNVDMARDIIKTYPHPGDLLVAIDHELDSLEVSYRMRYKNNADKPGVSTIRHTVYRLLPAIYGERANKFFDQAHSEAAEQQKADQEAPEATNENEPEYRNREILGSSGLLRLEIRGSAAKTLNASQQLIAKTRNAIATPKLIWRTWKRDKAQEKYDRKKKRVGTGNFLTNRIYASSAARAQAKLNKRTKRYNDHKNSMDARTTKADTSSETRLTAFRERVKYHSEKKIAAEQKKILRRVRNRRKNIARREGKKGLELHNATHSFTQEEMKRIREQAIKAARRKAMSDGKFLPGDR